MKYIDADLLRKEIEHRIDILSDVSIKCAKNDDMEMHNYYHGKAISLDELLSFIDSLQQEQPAQKKNCAGCPHCIDRKDQYGWHFKGCFGGPYKGKFIAEIDECPLQQEQPEADLEKASRNVYESWMGGTMDNVRRDMVELGKVLNARKEGKK